MEAVGRHKHLDHPSKLLVSLSTQVRRWLGGLWSRPSVEGLQGMTPTAIVQYVQYVQYNSSVHCRSINIVHLQYVQYYHCTCNIVQYYHAIYTLNITYSVYDS